MRKIFRQVPIVFVVALFSFSGALLVRADTSQFSGNTITKNEGSHASKIVTKFRETLVNATGNQAAENVVNDDNVSKTGVVGSGSVSKSGKDRKISRSRSKALVEGCFTDCLANSVPPDVVLACADACASGNYGQCAVCLGVGVGIVVSCAIACAPLND